MKWMTRRIAWILVAVMLLQMLPALSGGVVSAAVEDGFLTTELVGSSFNGEGVWITEIYNNDVDRSVANDTREANGYVPIKLYNSTSDLMEYLEVCSTHDDPIKLNDLYEVYYGTTLLTITTVDGSSDVTLTKGQPVVLWNYRTDVTATLPTEAEFREAHRIPDGALVLKITNGKGWDSGATYTVKRKGSGETTCTFTTVNETNVKDGFAVELQLPLMGSAMEVYRNMTLPSAGYVYARQLRGLIVANTLEGFDGKGVYITEIRPNDVDRSSSYGSASDFMECLEIVNTTDSAIDLNTQYQVTYVPKEGHRKILQLRQYSASASNHVGSATGCTVPAGGTAVLWCYRYSGITDYTSFPTLSNFRSAYGISSSTPVYIFTNQNSFNNTNRGVEVFKLASDGSLGQLVSSYSYLGPTDCADNKSAHLQINPEGPEMLLYSANTASTIGTVDAAQLSYKTDYGDAVKMHVADGSAVPESILQGEDLRVNFWYDFNGRTSRTNTCTYYRFDGTGDWMLATEGGIRLPNIYEMILPAYELFDHDYVEFYVVNSNTFRDTICGIYTVKIQKLNEVDGIRTNISDGEAVRGTVSVTANDGGTNASTKIYIDGVQQTTKAMLEDGAYFSFLTKGIDSYYKDCLTTTGNVMVKDLGEFLFVDTLGRVVHVDNSLFTYSSSSYKVTLRFWAGTFGTSVDDYLLPSANRDDYQVSHLQLKLPNGNTYLPTSIGPSSYGGVDTSAKTNLSTSLDAVHNIGDSNKWCPYMDVTFSVPSSQVNAVGVSVDTTKLSEGTHTLKVTNGTSTKEVTFIVDNTAPGIDMGFADGASLAGQITIAPKITEANGVRTLTVLLDGEPVEAPYDTTAYALGQGTHTVTVRVEDMAGNIATKESDFVVEDISMTLTDAGARDITHSSAQLYLTAQSGSATDVTFYRAQKIETADITTSTSGGLLPHIQYTLSVPDAEDGDEIRVAWDGTASGADDAHATTMFVRNTATGAWDQVGVADGDGTIQTIFPAADHVADGKATVIVQCTAESAVPDLDTVTDGITGNNSGWDGSAAPKDYDFSFAWISDTQGYVQRYQSHFLQMNQWIVDNAESWKIKYVMHTGDVVDDWDAVYQWENADEAMKIFEDAGMPYGVLGGNHDVAAGLNDYANYVKYFGEDRVKDQSCFGGSYKDNLGHYDLVSQDGQDFIIVYMSWNIYEEEIDWMNEVLAKYSDRKAILCFHAYTHVWESMDGLLDYYGVLIRDQVVAKNPNVFAVLNGHYSGATYQTVRFDDDGDGKKDRTVYQICTDYQSLSKGGLQYIKFLYFDLDDDKVFINSYSPYMDDFNYFDGTAPDLGALATASSTGVVSGTDIDPVILDVDFSLKAQTILEDSFSAELLTDEVLGKATLGSATGSAQVDVTGLEAETGYRWYAVLENADTGVLVTDSSTFTTQAAPVHEYVAEVTAPTCTEKGYTTYTCSICGDSYTDNETAAIGHSYWSVVTAPTCTEKGYTTHTCSVCGDTYKDGETAATGHSYGSVVTAPGCTSSGYTTHTCSICGDTYKDSETAATGHSYGAWVETKAPSCTEKGELKRTCTSCDDYQTQSVAVLDHSYDAVVTAPTCTTEGYTTYTCAACGHSYVSDTVAALEHSYQVTVSRPSCTEAGSVDYLCATCGDAYSEEVQPNGHSYSGGICTVCGAADPEAVVQPTLTLKYPSLSFEAEILYNVYYVAENIDDVVEMGLLTFDSEVADGSIDTATDVIPGFETDGTMWKVGTNGISAKNLGDDLYFMVYAELSDGSYVYSAMKSYSAVSYASTILKRSTSSDYMKALVVSMLNYGTEAQLYFEHRTDSLMNASLTAEQQALVGAYDESMMDSVVAVDTVKAANFIYDGSSFARRAPSVSFDGAFSINYYFTAANAPDDGMTLYYWNIDDYLAADVLTVDNATGSMEMVATETENQYWGNVAGIAAKELDQTVFVVGVYEHNGTTYTTGILNYSIGKYCEGIAANSASNQQAFAQATAVYGYCAKEYFANL